VAIYPGIDDNRHHYRLQVQTFPCTSLLFPMITPG